MPVTSQQWWAEIKQNPTKFNEWLRKQYHGEVTAASRIRAMADETVNAEAKRTLEVIASQEEQHALWVKELLDNRNIDPGQHDATARYWSEVSAAAVSFDDKAAIAALAEGMRLERIRVIVGDESAPPDVRFAFERILHDEEWHERAFTQLAKPETIEKVRPYHTLGREVLGLEA